MMMDNCTLWPEGWWSACCAAHDVNYGGLVPRMVADETLAQCIVALAPDSGGFAVLTGFIATLMYFGTRLFGWAFYKKGYKK